MANEPVNDNDRKLAEKCLACPVCRRARKKQRGLCFWFVKRVEPRICPACQAYGRVYGRPAHEPIAGSRYESETSRHTS